MPERLKYGLYDDLPGRPTDAEFDEMWAYISAVADGTCDGHWYDFTLDSWVLVHGYFYSSDPDHRPRLQSSLHVHQRFFAACRERRITITQGLEHVQLADKIREILPWSHRLIISDMDDPIAIEKSLRSRYRPR